MLLLILCDLHTLTHTHAHTAPGGRQPPKPAKLKRMMKLKDHEVDYTVCGLHCSAIITKDGKLYMYGSVEEDLVDKSSGQSLGKNSTLFSPCGCSFASRRTRVQSPQGVWLFPTNPASHIQPLALRDITLALEGQDHWLCPVSYPSDVKMGLNVHKIAHIDS